MSLEATLYQQDLFSHNNNINPLLLEVWNKLQDNSNNHDHNSSTYDINTSNYFHDDNQLEFDWHSYNYEGINHIDNTITMPPLGNFDHDECWGLVDINNFSSSPEEVAMMTNEGCAAIEVAARPKQRRRGRAKKKNEEEIENQRMTHIAVERNRRKQMNEYLNVIRSLMPHSYVKRGDQASIVGGAINFIKELEHNVLNLSAKKQMKENLQTNNQSSTTSLPFEEFFTFPQFSTSNNNNNNNNNGDENDDDQIIKSIGPTIDHQEVDNGPLGADIEVTMVECHAHLKIRLRRSIKQLSKLVSGLHTLRLSILHLNVNTADDAGVVLYSFSLKVGDEAKLSSVDELARAVYLLLSRIQEDTIFNC